MLSKPRPSNDPSVTYPQGILIKLILERLIILIKPLMSTSSTSLKGRHRASRTVAFFCAQWVFTGRICQRIARPSLRCQQFADKTLLYCQHRHFWKGKGQCYAPRPNEDWFQPRETETFSFNIPKRNYKDH